MISFGFATVDSIFRFGKAWQRMAGNPLHTHLDVIVSSLFLPSNVAQIGKHIAVWINENIQREFCLKLIKERSDFQKRNVIRFYGYKSRKARW